AASIRLCARRTKRARAGRVPGEAAMTEFSEAERRAVYRVIYERRDVRSQFLRDPVPDDVLTRILDAAHHAPSVGFMQPWEFIVITDALVRRAVRQQFEDTNTRAA